MPFNWSAESTKSKRKRRAQQAKVRARLLGLDGVYVIQGRRRVCICAEPTGVTVRTVHDMTVAEVERQLASGGIRLPTWEVRK